MLHSAFRCLSIALLLASCGGGDPNPEPGPEDAADEAGSTFWQLADDSVLTAWIEPWPADPGPVTLRAEASLDDAEQAFAGSLEVRVGDGDWVPVPSTSSGEEGTVGFETVIELAGGANAVALRVQDDGDPGPYELQGWTVDVE